MGTQEIAGIMRPDGGRPPLDASWEAFKIAAKRDDIDLAKADVGYLHLSIRHKLQTLLTRKPLCFFDDIPPGYIYALIRISFDSSLSPCPAICGHRDQINVMDGPYVVKVLTPAQLAKKSSLE